MTWRRRLSQARKALRRRPRWVLARLAQAVRRQARRPWSRIRPGLLTDRALLRRTGAASMSELWERLLGRPFFVPPAGREEWSRRFLDTFPHAKPEIVEAGEAILAHRFDLLGSGPVTLDGPLPWHTDFKTGRRWPLEYCHDIDYNELDRPSDVKVPWELSRCQHFTILGQAYWLTGDERFAREFVEQVTDWVQRNPWSYGVNWACTMDVALRAISWLWGLYYFGGAGSCEPEAFRSLLLRALFLHGEFVAANIELGDVNGNHYFMDGVGLTFLGVFFGRSRSGQRWLERGRRILFEEILAQTWPDGVDFEQATAYHRLVLEAAVTACLLLRLDGEPVPEDVWRRLERMHEFVGAYTKPDGRAPLIGDADDGRVQKLGLQPISDHRYLLSTGAVLFGRRDFKQAAGQFWEESFWQLGPAGLEAYEALSSPPVPSVSVAFPAGGIYVLRGAGTHLVVDCAEIGLRGRGGHGHNDILSFELFLNGMNVVTDCGAYLYTASREWRNLFRSTAFHNTVQVDGEELNRFVHPDELWRLHYDAAPTPVTWRPGEAAEYFRGGHRGYARLVPPVLHEREIAVHKRLPRVAFRDSLTGGGVHRLTWRFHLDPAARPEHVGNDVRLATGDGREAWFLPMDGGADFRPRLEPGWVSPSYGVKLATTVVVVELTARLPFGVEYVFADRSLHPSERRDVIALLDTSA